MLDALQTGRGLLGDDEQKETLEKIYEYDSTQKNVQAWEFFNNQVFQT